MKATSVTVYVCAGYIVVLTGSAAINGAPPLDTGKETISKVFAQYPKGKEEIWSISGYARYAPVRPLQQSTFAPLRKYFSYKQQRNLDKFLRALSKLIDTRNRLAKRLKIHETWWPTGIDLLKVDAVLSRDLLNDRSDNPDQMDISMSKTLNGKLQFTVKEVFTEVGQDRVLGKGTKTSTVYLIPENGRWVIDEVKSIVTDAYGDTHMDTLSELLQDGTTTLRDTQHAIRKLPQTLEIRKGQDLSR